MLAERNLQRRNFDLFGPSNFCSVVVRCGSLLIPVAEILFPFAELVRTRTSCFDQNSFDATSVFCPGSKFSKFFAKI